MYIEISLFITKNSGVDIKLPVMGYDPRDLLSGHYIQYQIDWEKADCNQFEDSVCHKDNFCIDATLDQQQAAFELCAEVEALPQQGAQPVW